MCRSTPSAPGSEPDPRQGVFETILIFENRPIELAAHLDRLGRGVRGLYGIQPPETLAEEVLAASAAAGWGVCG